MIQEAAARRSARLGDNYRSLEVLTATLDRAGYA
jgi:hypothetical protein